MNLEKHFDEVITLISVAKTNAYRAVNTELVNLYWNIGEFISNKIKTEDWGKGIVKNLSLYIKKNAPEMKGFSSQNLWRMKQFYEAYEGVPNLSTLLREIPWSHNMKILATCKSNIEKEYYIRLSINEKLSFRELERQIDSCAFERLIVSKNKLSTTLREVHPDAKKIFKDKYVLDFLQLPNSFSEKNLRKQIILKLKSFILEFGKDFTFVGEEYRIQVGKKDFYIDLLFYHRELQCLVAIDLKITDFKPEYLGKIEFYLEALDKDVKKEHEKPSIGLILCKNKDTKVVEYALNRSMSATMISEYETKLIDKKLLENKLEEFFNNRFEDNE